MALTPACVRRSFSRPARAMVLGVGMVGVACSSNGLKVLEQPPSVVITEPSAGSSFYEGQAVNFVALVEAGGDGDDVTDVMHMWVSGNITMCESDNVGGDGYAYCSYAFTDVGEHTVEITVTDSRSDRAKASTTVIIVDNTPPTSKVSSLRRMSSFALTPSSVTSRRTLRSLWSRSPRPWTGISAWRPAPPLPVTTRPAST
jgi:hypothetical protein